MSLLLMQVAVIWPVGAGLGIYRTNDKKELEFLLVRDPYQKQSWRKGFEFPAGTIGDYGHQAVDQLDGAKIDQLPEIEKKRMTVKSFLRGAIREALEELVFVPAMTIIPGHPYCRGKIDKNFELNAIDTIAERIAQRELVCLRYIQDRINYTIFFWDVSNLSSERWLPQMQSQRETLLIKWASKVSAIGAEPDSFAWVSAKELQAVIAQAQKDRSMNRTQSNYCVTASELMPSRGSLQRNVPIKLSSAFVGLIRRPAQYTSHRPDEKILNMSEIICRLRKNN